MIVKDKPTVVWEYMLQINRKKWLGTASLKQRCCLPNRLKKQTLRLKSATESKRRRLAPLGYQDGMIRSGDVYIVLVVFIGGNAPQNTRFY